MAFNMCLMVGLVAAPPTTCLVVSTLTTLGVVLLYPDELVAGVLLGRANRTPSHGGERNDLEGSSACVAIG